MNPEFDDDDDDSDEDLGEFWDATCWPFTTVRGGFEYTLVKVAHDTGGTGPGPKGWEYCQFQCSIPSPASPEEREQFIQKEKLWASEYGPPRPPPVPDADGWVVIRARNGPLPEECWDCQCWYTDLNNYFVYRRKVG